MTLSLRMLALFQSVASLMRAIENKDDDAQNQAKNDVEFWCEEIVHSFTTLADRPSLPTLRHTRATKKQPKRKKNA